MKKANLSLGQEVTLEQVLLQRDQRVHLIRQLSDQYPQHSILSFKLNIPGPIKNNDTIKAVFNEGLNALPSHPVKQVVANYLAGGPEAILVYTMSPSALKQQMVTLEETHPLGRLFDCDVESIKRQDLGYSGRQCLICDQQAQVCGRSRTHSVDQLIAKIEEIIDYSNLF